MCLTVSAQVAQVVVARIPGALYCQAPRPEVAGAEHILTPSHAIEGRFCRRATRDPSR